MQPLRVVLVRFQVEYGQVAVVLLAMLVMVETDLQHRLMTMVMAITALVVPVVVVVVRNVMQIRLPPVAVSA